MRVFLKALLFTLPLLKSPACCDFLLKDDGNIFMHARAMEYSQELKPELIIHPQGETWTSVAPKEEKGLSWVSKYGYASMTSLGVDKPVDGLNEKGLSLSVLWYTGAEYPEAQDPLKALAIEDFGQWILGNFATIEEVREGLKQVEIWQPSKSSTGVHISLYDLSGKGAVVEFIKGKAVLLENPAQVLTNSPRLEWQTTNLQNYIALGAPLTFTPSEDKTTPYGANMKGLPGDWSSSSRFVRLFFTKNLIKKPTSRQGAVTLALHILNTMDIPEGLMAEATGLEKVKEFPYTQWVVVKDLKEKKITLHTYHNPATKEINLMSYQLDPGYSTVKVQVK